MEFSSYLFLLAFLPVALALYYALALSPLHRLRLPALCLLTLAFYANAAARYVPLLLASVVLNYLCARAIARTEGRTRHLILSAGVVANLAVLVFYKYAAFAVANLSALFGTGWTFPALVLPLAISFFTFQQIAFLVEASRNRSSVGDPVSYASAILFFPYIVSGPITFVREAQPQLAHRPHVREVPGNLLVGLVMFAIGLFKKTVIANGYALWVDPLYASVQHGEALGTGGAWLLAVAYLLQIYFDFSGYSDMAIGVARMLGIVLPLNFVAPLRSTSIIDYWRRWHMTLGRWVNLYIFLPIGIPLSRLAAARGFGRRGMLAVGTLIPTFITMLVIGVWHGGSWTFFLFGALHGTFMVVNETWRFATRKRRKGRQPTRLGSAAANLLTMLAVIIPLTTFRAPDLPTTWALWAQMLGLGSGQVPAAWPVFATFGAAGLLLALLPGIAIVYLLPTTQQFVARFEPALEWAKWRTVSPPRIRMTWTPNAARSLAIGIVLLLGAAFVARGSTSFVYFGF